MKSAFSRYFIGVIILYAVTSFPPFGGNKGGCQNLGINTTGATPNAKAALDIDVSPGYDKGVLMPRLTTAQRNAITAPVPASLLIYNTTTECFEAYDATTSTWVALGCLGCQLPGTFVATTAGNVFGTSFDANWSASEGATTYFLDISTVSDFSTFIPGYNNLNVGNVFTASVTGLPCAATTYYYRVRANNSCGTSANSNTIAVTTLGCIVYKIYAIGGAGPLSTNEEYDPAANTWATKAAMPTARFYLSAAAANNKIYAIGGVAGGSSTSTNEQYDPALNSWATKAAMPTARGYLAAAAVNNKIYAIGGTSTGTDNLSTNEEYDPATNTWATKAAMPTARKYLAATTVNNKIYAIGGSGGLTVNEEYDPATNTWAIKAAMPTARYFLAAAAVNNKIYAIGGVDGAAVNEEYDPAGNTWATKAAMPTARQGLSAAAAYNKIYVIGGIGGANVNEQYDPALNSWATKAAMPTARDGLGAAVAQ